MEQQRGGALRRPVGRGARRALVTQLVLAASMIFALANEVEAAARSTPGLPDIATEVMAEQTDQGIDPRVKVRGTEIFQRSVHRALDLLRRELASESAAACHRYFRQEGVQLSRWVEPTSPPYVVEVPRTWFPRHLRRNACAAAQGSPPHLYLFIASDCAHPDDTDGIASLLLHELGHLARRDTEDREPLSFFEDCQLASGVQPGRYH